MKCKKGISLVLNPIFNDIIFLENKEIVCLGMKKSNIPSNSLKSLFGKALKLKKRLLILSQREIALAKDPSLSFILLILISYFISFD